LTYTTGQGEMIYYNPGPNPFDLDGSGVGAMLGYNFATGPWVFGAELAYSTAEIGIATGAPGWNFTSMIDLKARAGYAMNNMLFYGTLGKTVTQWQEGAGSGGNDGDGFLYGVGEDYLVSPRFFVGAEYLVRDVTSDWNNNPGDYFDAKFNTLTLRVGRKF
jgi:outer membrane immunogenic protein